jgi:hypothetical protein
MGAVNALACYPTDTVNINVASTTASVLVAANGTTRPVRVYNDGTATVWINWGGSSVTATTTAGLPIAAGACEVLTVQTDGATSLYFAAIAAGSTGKIYFTPGSDGI